jgi:hypothetical protein
MTEEIKKLDLGAVLADSVLAPVIAVLESGKFDLVPHDEIQEGEEFLTELTDFEKAVQTVSHRIGTDHNTSVKAEKSGGDYYDIATAKNNVEIHKVLVALFWRSIRNRLLAMGRKDALEITIRESVKVVAKPRHDDLEDFFSMLMEGMGNPSGIMAVMNHDCPNCPRYDECDNPSKEARV